MQLRIIACGVCLDSQCNTDPYMDHRRMQLILEAPVHSVQPQRKGGPPKAPKTPRVDFSILRSDPSLQKQLQLNIDSKIKAGVELQDLNELNIPSSIDAANEALDNAIRESCIAILPMHKRLLRR